MLEVVEKILYCAAFIGQALLIVIGVKVIMVRRDKVAGAVFILGGVIGLNVLVGRTVVGFLVGPTVLALSILSWLLIDSFKSASREKRRYYRAEVSWPVVLFTPNGPVAGVTQNLSLGGALVRCPDVPEMEEIFRLVIKPAARQVLQVNAEKVWSDTLVSEDYMPRGMGVSFRFAAGDEDRQLIGKAISKHIWPREVFMGRN